MLFIIDVLQNNSTLKSFIKLTILLTVFKQIAKLILKMTLKNLPDANVEDHSVQVQNSSPSPGHRGQSPRAQTEARQVLRMQEEAELLRGSPLRGRLSPDLDLRGAWLPGRHQTTTSSSSTTRSSTVTYEDSANATASSLDILASIASSSIKTSSTGTSWQAPSTLHHHQAIRSSRTSGRLAQALYMLKILMRERR